MIKVTCRVFHTPNLRLSFKTTSVSLILLRLRPRCLQNDKPESALDWAGAGVHQVAHRAVKAARVASAEGKQPGLSAAEPWKV